MSYNKFGEYELCQDCTHETAYFITRDREGHHVLREGSYDGKELFSPINDAGKKNTKRGRVFNAQLFYDMMK